MLGFSPLASAPLADDGAIASVVYLINADNIVTGQAVVGQSSITQGHELLSDGVTAGSPTIPSVTMSEEETFNADPINSAQPTLGAPTFEQDHELLAGNIATGRPRVPLIYVNPSVRRRVHVSNPSNNITVVAIAPNSAILPKVEPNGTAVVASAPNSATLLNTPPNGVIVLQPNEAA